MTGRKPEATEARMLLSVIEYAQNPVAIADYDTRSPALSTPPECT